MARAQRSLRNALAKRALEIAEKRLGLVELSRRLQTADTTIRAWRFGHENMPPKKFRELLYMLDELQPS